MRVRFGRRYTFTLHPPASVRLVEEAAAPASGWVCLCLCPLKRDRTKTDRTPREVLLRQCSPADCSRMPKRKHQMPPNIRSATARVYMRTDTPFSPRERLKRAVRR